jgi:UDP-glucose 4-epimerase
MMEKQRVVVTGGNGFFGHVLCRKLMDVYDVAVLDRFIDQRQPQRISQVCCDITDEDRVEDFLLEYRPQFIVHLAAVTGVRRCEEQPRETLLVNVLGTHVVADLASKIGCFLVFASSREVYGETMCCITREEDQTNPKNLYGLTKLAGEQILRYLNRRRGLRFAILRFTSLYGPGGDQYATSIIVKRALSGQEILILGGSQILNLIHVRDAARAIELVLRQPTATSCTTLNIGSNESLTVEELVRRILQITGSHSPVCRAEMRSGDIVHFVPELIMSSRLLGFSAEIPLEEGLQELARLYQTGLE